MRARGRLSRCETGFLSCPRELARGVIVEKEGALRKLMEQRCGVAEALEKCNAGEGEKGSAYGQSSWYKMQEKL